MPSKRPPRRRGSPRKPVPATSIPYPSSHPGAELIPWVDLLRFLAILLVLGHHLTGCGLPIDGSTGAHWGWFHSAFANGAFGVAIFFTVSGFLITRMLLGPAGRGPMGFRVFYGRRVARIFPLLVLVVVAGLLLRGLEGPAWGGSGFCLASDRTMMDRKFWLALLTFQFNWLVITRISMGVLWAVMWSLAVEEQFYVTYPFLTRWLGRGPKLALFLGTVFVAGFLFRYWAVTRAQDASLVSYYASPACFDQIAVGALAFLATEKWREPLGRRAGEALALFGGLGALMLAGLLWGVNFDDLAQRWWATGGVGMATALLLVGGVHHPVLRGAAWRTASWPGRLSYGCYLWHIPVLFLAWPILAGRGAGTAVSLFLVLVLGFSTVSYYGFELPANRWVRARWGTGAPAAPRSSG